MLRPSVCSCLVLSCVVSCVVSLVCSCRCVVPWCFVFRVRGDVFPRAQGGVVISRAARVRVYWRALLPGPCSHHSSRPWYRGVSQKSKGVVHFSSKLKKFVSIKIFGNFEFSGKSEFSLFALLPCAPTRARVRIVGFLCFLSKIAQFPFRFFRKKFFYFHISCCLCRFLLCVV